LRVLREISQSLESLQAISTALQNIATHQSAVLDRQEDAGAMSERLEGLELSQSRWEAEMEGHLQRADSALKAARNAEERTRTMKKSYEKHQLDPFNLDGEEAEATPVPAGYAPAGEAERVQPVHLDVAPVNSKAYALRAKYQL